MNRLLARAACATLFAFVPPAAQAGVPTLAECLEGSDFIANAARARDNGIARTTFLARIEEDFIVIRAFPPALRWFVKDDDDERFLRGAAARVFDQPLAPDHHHADFLAACLERAVA
jgi:hypothetical protein